MGPGIYGFFSLHFLPIFWPRYSLFIKENDVNIDKQDINFQFFFYRQTDILLTGRKSIQTYLS